MSWVAEYLPFADISLFVHGLMSFAIASWLGDLFCVFHTSHLRRLALDSFVEAAWLPDFNHYLNNIYGVKLQSFKCLSLFTSLRYQYILNILH